MSSLFNLTGEYLALAELAGEPGTLENQAFLDTLDGLTGEIEEKADSYAYVMSTIDGQIDMVEKELDRLGKIKSALKNHKQAMKDNLFNCMKAMAKSEIKTDLHKFKICKNGGKLPLVFDKEEKPEYFPEKYRKITVSLDKDKIRADLEAGVELAGAHLGERGENLRIT